MKKQNPTWKSVAEALAIDVKTLAGYRKKLGAPKEPDLSAWQLFVAENGLGHSDNKASADREYWLTEKARLEARRLQRAEKLAEGTTITLERAIQIVQQGFQLQKSSYRRVITKIVNRFHIDAEGRHWIENQTCDAEDSAADEFGKLSK